MSFMLSSEVRTNVGPNTRAKLRGSIWTHQEAEKNKTTTVEHKGLWRDACDGFKTAFDTPCFCRSGLQPSSSGWSGISECDDNDLEDLGSATKQQTREPVQPARSVNFPEISGGLKAKTNQFLHGLQSLRWIFHPIGINEVVVLVCLEVGQIKASELDDPITFARIASMQACWNMCGLTVGKERLLKLPEEGFE